MTAAGDGAPEIVLASASPRRREILIGLGLEPVVVAAEVDETPRPGEEPDRLVERLARAKARAVSADLDSPERGPSPSGDGHRPGPGHRLIIGADTVIDCDGAVLGKPIDVADAARMLRRLSGRSHAVVTGVSVTGWLAGRPVEASTTDRTTVVVRALSDHDIEWYLGTGEPMGKAGAYAIQGLGSILVDRIEGSFHGVVGLPVAALDRLLSSLGVPLVSLAGGPARTETVG